MFTAFAALAVFTVFTVSGKPFRLPPGTRSTTSPQRRTAVRMAMTSVLAGAAVILSVGPAATVADAVTAPAGAGTAPAGAVTASGGPAGEQPAAVGSAGAGQFSVYTDINQPADIVAGSDGALWFTNSGTASIGRITTGGAITNYSVATIGRPAGIAAGPDGALWFTDNNSIGRITTSGAITDFTSPTLSSPSSITRGPDGALWFTNSGGAPSIGRITTSGVITRYTGPGLSTPSGITTGPDGALWFTNTTNNSVGRLTTSGVVTNFTDPAISEPLSIARGSDGALWFTSAGNDSIDRITTAGVVSRHSGPDISVGVFSRITSGPDNALWFTSGTAVQRMTTAGAVTDFPGAAGPITTGPDGALWFAGQYPTLALGRITTAGVMTTYNGMNQPEGITAGPDGALWFVNAGNSGRRSIGRITTSGSVSDFVDPAITSPWDIARGPDNAMWFTTYSTIGRITTSGVVTTFTQSGVFPTSITAGPDGALWFTNNNVFDPIGRVTTAGVFTFFTGTGINDPTAITAGPDGALWFTNTGNSSIGRISTGGAVSNYTGTHVFEPDAITRGPDGALWFTNNSVYVGRITTSGAISTFTAPGIAAAGGITAGPDGALWFSNPAYNGIGRVTTAGVFTSYLYPGYTLQGQRIMAGADGALWFTNPGNQAIGRITTGSAPLAGGFTPLSPSRILDTRIAIGATGPVLAGGTVTLTVAGRGGVPLTGAGAVVLNVTVTQPKGGGYLTVWPDGSTRPTASNLDFSPGQTVPNLVVARLGADGKVKLYNGSGGTVQLIGDVAGYFGAGAPGPGGLAPLTPSRILDSRIGIGSGGPVPAGGTVTLTVTGRGGVPASGAGAVVLNVTVTQPKSGGYLTVWPDGTTRPTASNLDFSPGLTVSNLVIAQLGSDGKVKLYNGSGGTVQMIGDVAGYFAVGAPGPGGLFPLAPSRIMDSRVGSGATGPILVDETVPLQVAGRGGVPPSGAGAAILNVTVTQPKAGGYLTVWPAGSTRPTASNLDFSAGQTVPNLVVASIGDQGQVALYNGSAGTLHLIGDVLGYFRAD